MTVRLGRKTGVPSREPKRLAVVRACSFPITIQPKFVAGESSQVCTSDTIRELDQVKGPLNPTEVVALAVLT